MPTIQTAGEAMLLMQEGNRMIAAALAHGVRALMRRVALVFRASSGRPLLP